MIKKTNIVLSINSEEEVYLHGINEGKATKVVALKKIVHRSEALIGGKALILEGLDALLDADGKSVVRLYKKILSKGMWDKVWGKAV